MFLTRQTYSVVKKMFRHRMCIFLCCFSLCIFGVESLLLADDRDPVSTTASPSPSTLPPSSSDNEGKSIQPPQSSLEFNQDYKEILDVLDSDVIADEYERQSKDKKTSSTATSHAPHADMDAGDSGNATELSAETDVFAVPDIDEPSDARTQGVDKDKQNALGEANRDHDQSSILSHTGMQQNAREEKDKEGPQPHQSQAHAAQSPSEGVSQAQESDNTTTNIGGDAISNPIPMHEQDDNQQSIKKQYVFVIEDGDALDKLISFLLMEAEDVSFETIQIIEPIAISSQMIHTKHQLMDVLNKHIIKNGDNTVSIHITQGKAHFIRLILGSEPH